MKSSIILTGAMLFSSAMAGATGPIASLGCYKTTAGTIFKNSDVGNSRGRCGNILCPQAGSFALQNWKCFCGDEKPMDSEKVDDANCNKNCPGFPTDVCGGKDGSGFYSFYDNGNLNSLPQVAGSSSSTSTSATSTSTSASVPTTTSTPSATPTVSATPTAEPPKVPNVAGIAAGVVVGVLAILAIVGGLFFFMRNRKRRAIEEEHRRNAVINSAKPPINSAATSFNDTRLDPVMAHRRMSDGSIADNQDYSRRILKVTNA